LPAALTTPHDGVDHASGKTYSMVCFPETSDNGSRCPRRRAVIGVSKGSRAMWYPLKFLAPIILALFLTGCFGDTKADILKKAKGAETTEQLEAALGPPDEVDKLGPLEQWSYEASDGKVVFAIVAGRVTLEATADKSRN
jgi:hypothetical protein